MARVMKIGELAQVAGVNPRTIRFYENKGLLSPTSRGANNYRQYSDKELAHLVFIRRAQSFGLSLEEIHTLLQYRMAGSCSGLKSRLNDLLSAKITEIQKRSDELLAFSRDLKQIRCRLRNAATRGVSPAPSFCDCLPARLPPDLNGGARDRLDLVTAKFTGRKEVRNMAVKKTKSPAKASAREKPAETRPSANCGCGCVVTERK